MAPYDLTKVKIDPKTGMVKTGTYSEVNPQYLGEAGYQQALSYASPEFQRGLETRKPVSVLSTERAAETVEKKLGALNEMSPSTAPGYQAPTPTDKPVLPKAYFANEAGQEAEYNETQLKDPNTRKFLQENGYVMTKTEGPTVAGAEVGELNTRMEGLVNQITSYNVDADPGFIAQAESIKNQYVRLREDMQIANKQRAGVVAMMGIRGGTTRYAGGVQAGIEGEELRQSADRIADINAREANAISAARHAYRTGKFSEFNTQVTALEKLRSEKQKEMEAANKALTETRKKFNETVGKATRDAAIADLVAQGVTDAGQLLEILNFDEQGKLVGDFTAKEVAETLKLISPGNELKNLTGTVKEFYALKGAGALPESITGLPEDEQFFSYLTMKKAATTPPPKPKTPGKPGVPPGVKTITEPQARARGLPYSVVGSSEQEIVNSLQQPKPPAWFMEKLIQEQGNDNYAETIWNEYRNKVNNVSSKAASDTTDKGPVKLYSK